MLDENPTESDPYAPSKVATNDDVQRISTLDDVIDYAKQHRSKSLFCTFLCKLGDQHPEAVSIFLNRFVAQKLDKPNDSIPIELETYQLKLDGNAPVNICEKTAYREAYRELNITNYFDAFPNRRQILAKGTLATGLAMFTMTARNMGCNVRVVQNNQAGANNNQNVADLLTIGISTALIAIGLIYSAKLENEQQAKHQNPTIEIFDEFIKDADKKLLESGIENDLIASDLKSHSRG